MHLYRLHATAQHRRISTEKKRSFFFSGGRGTWQEIHDIGKGWKVSMLLIGSNMRSIQKIPTMVQ